MILIVVSLISLPFGIKKSLSLYLLSIPAGIVLSSRLFNSGGPLFSEARSSLYDLPNKPYCINYIYGLGGRDITVEDYYEIFNDLFIIHDTDDPGDIYRYVGVRDSRYGERGFDHRKYED